jgi:HPt (histidine-containing phosphotransfer) domain-containing protein
MLVDDALALERMGGMPELLARISQAYARTLPRELALWRQCWAAGDTEQALRVLHTLKGTAASLGALPLAQALRELEEACRDATDTAPPTRRALTRSLPIWKTSPCNAWATGWVINPAEAEALGSGQQATAGTEQPG